MYMNSLTYKPAILEAFENVRNFSFEEKKEAAFDEKKINNLLDSILDFKQSLTRKTDKIENLIERIEKITWFDNLDQDALLLINDLVSSIRNLYSSLQRQYVYLNFIRSKGIAKEEVKDFKAAIDDLKEIANDLDSRFFFLPANDEFEETTKELSLI
jgi:hypothetical protein